ncbi:MAG: arylsulfotransferase family protein [Gammaproteobacteria bacterium]|nr:arylsulfotransferase family protein [Gammaproteobacteria bacterium]
MQLQQTGVTYSCPDQMTPGYVLFAPGGGNQVFLIDYKGQTIHQWHDTGGLTHWCYLLPNGNLFVNERCENPAGVALTSSGLMREYDWSGNLVFEFQDPWQHHDARRLSNGHIVYLAFTPLQQDEQAKIKGGLSGSESEAGIVGECIREVDANGKVVWEWHFTQFAEDQFPIHPNANRWSRGHTNTVFPMPDGNYLISCKILNLLFIVDRQTSEVIWYYQNNEMGGQHDAQLLDSGNILLFANGVYAPDLHHSQVWEINPLSNEIVWRYRAQDNPQSFFSPHIGGCQRLPSGNTLICEGAKGCLFEVTPNGDIVWEYVCPHFNQTQQFGRVNWLFRARHYSQDCEELNGRL